MITYAILRPSGCIDVFGHDRVLPEGAVLLPEGIDTSYYFHEGAWLPRPALERDGLSFPLEVTWEVQDAETGAWLGGAVDTSLTLPDPGSYRIVVTPPDPWAKIEPFVVSIEE